MASFMGSLSDQNLSCPICLEIFKDPVILQCSHSFCADCWQQTIAGNATLECPICRTQSFQRDPPRNLALKNLCEDFLKVKTEQCSTGPEDLCSLHSEKLKLFCLDHQQPVCLVCLHSNSHINHRHCPIDEAAQEGRVLLQSPLKRRRKQLELLNDVQVNFDQTAREIDVQTQDVERQIKDASLLLQYFLKEEEQRRIDAVRKERDQKSQMMKEKSDALSRQIAALTDTVRDTEELLRAADVSFLQKFRAAADRVQHSPHDVPKLIPEGLIDKIAHVDYLSYSILDSLKAKVTSTLYPQTADPDPRSPSPLRQPTPTNTPRRRIRNPPTRRPLPIRAAEEDD